MESALASNGNTVELTGMEDSQVLVKTRAKVGRLQKSLRNLKGQLTKEVNMCLKKITHFKRKYSDDYLANSVVKTNYAQSILDSQTRCETRYLNLEKALSELRELECETWAGSDEDLDEILSKLDNDSVVCEKQFSDVQRDNDDIFDTCETLTAAARLPTIRPRPQAGANVTPTVPHTVFKPQTDLKPTFLTKDCTLPEFIKFTETFVTYMNSSGSVIPIEAVFSNLRVHIAPYWFTELIGKGLNIRTDLPAFPHLMDEISLMKFSLHNRRMTVFRAQQSWDAL